MLQQAVGGRHQHLPEDRNTAEKGRSRTAPLRERRSAAAVATADLEHTLPIELDTPTREDRNEVILRELPPGAAVVLVPVSLSISLFTRACMVVRLNA